VLTAWAKAVFAVAAECRLTTTAPAHAGSDMRRPAPRSRQEPPADGQGQALGRRHCPQRRRQRGAACLLQRVCTTAPMPPAPWPAPSSLLPRSPPRSPQRSPPMLPCVPSHARSLWPGCDPVRTRPSGLEAVLGCSRSVLMRHLHLGRFWVDSQSILISFKPRFSSNQTKPSLSAGVLRQATYTTTRLGVYNSLSAEVAKHYTAGPASVPFYVK
jgi:hypothetical protein